MHYTGQPVKRFADPHLVTGKGSFVDDVQLPDMLHTAVLRSPHAHARIRVIDVTAARSMPGVAAVLTGADIAGVLGMDALASVGVRHIDTPFTPEKIWRALHGAGGDRRDAATAAR